MMPKIEQDSRNLNARTHYWEYLDYVPLISMGSNLVHLWAKRYFSRNPLVCVQEEPYVLPTYRADMMDHSTRRCLALVLLPIISNIVCAIYDYYMKKQIEVEGSRSFPIYQRFLDESEPEKKEREALSSG